MTGRGFLKSRLALMNLNESEEPPKSVELPKPEEPLKFVEEPISHTDLPKVPISVTSTQTLVNGHQQVVRGRRALLNRYAQGSASQRLCENITTFSKKKIGNLKDIVCPAIITPMSQNSEISKLHSPATQPQPQILDIPAPSAVKEEKPPVICRVLEESEYLHMTQLSSNYIRVELEKDKGIHEYQVDFLPLIDAKKLRCTLLNQHKDKFPVKIFDGTLLYLPTMLPENLTILVGKLDDEFEVTLTLTYKRKHALHECVHFYNIFLNRIMKDLGLIEFGRSSFDPNKRKLIPDFKIEIWPGYKTTIDEFENGLFMCCEVSHRVLRTETVIDIMTNIMIKSKQLNTDGKQELMAVLCGSTVITHYNRKTYRIDDIDFSMNPLSTFLRNGIEISYLDYYRDIYKIEIKNLKQPMIITKAKKKDINNKNATKDSDICCLVPELCNLTGVTQAMINNNKLMKVIENHTLVTPEERQHAVIGLVNRINAHEVASQKFKNWGIAMRPVPVTMEGPVYKNENILLGNGIKKKVEKNMDWGSDVVKNAMFVAVNVLNWVIMYNPKDESSAHSFSRQLATCSRDLGMEINSPKNIKIHGSNPEVFVSNIHSIVSGNPQLQLIVIIFPNKRKDRYDAVKRICCTQIGIPSQVIISRTLSKPERLRSITQKIALQINCKLGGACWSIEIPLTSTMIVGIDVYHEKGKQLSSVVGFVASMDKTFTEWYSVAAMQMSTHQELMQSLQNAFHKVLYQFKDKNGLLPEKIIIFRDGVSYGEFQYVEEFELSGLIESFKSYPGNYNPKVSFIIVQKRINTRIFQYANERYLNPSPGTVVDNTITKRNYFDFFLVSQNPRQGTVNPTHYIVLKNGCELSAEKIQRLTYKLCHLYYNWCGTVKVPAPVLYAHKLAYLIGENVRQMPSENLCKSLFYL